jgi:hypothetical protein
MSFRLFIYYCGVWGGLAAYLGWVLGRLVSTAGSVGLAGIKGFYLGITVAIGVGLVDAIWNLWPGPLGRIAARVGAAAFVGALGGWLGGVLGQVLYNALDSGGCLLLGWSLTGLLIGASVGLFDYLLARRRGMDVRGPKRKVIHGLLGGALGGVLGGIGFLFLNGGWEKVLRVNPASFWSPGAIGFVTLGACIGLLIGLAQVILKEAWVRVEAGFRPGRQLILNRPVLTIGRAEGCDLGLFGDPSVERLHARIVQRQDRYYLQDAGSASGTFVNEHRLNHEYALCSGDLISLGNCRLRFTERRKHPGGAFTTRNE